MPTLQPFWVADFATGVATGAAAGDATGAATGAAAIGVAGTTACEATVSVMM